MFGKPKKTVSVAYKEKLLAQLAHTEKRIEEALNKRTQNSFIDEILGPDVTNPYKFKIQPSQIELKQQEVHLRDRVSKTLELSMLTIIQSEVNIMVTPPEVRKPVKEDGVWKNVVAECRIDLVPFTITFYAHKPYRRFGPTRYRSVAVSLTKPAHRTELAQSILPKLQLPNLALQVLQSYAAAFRSRRTTLLELAERYADKINMHAMPEGGYRVRFLDLIQVDWTLENLWSPIVPFGHRMKFEVEYMPRDYISAIGKLYKQFKDPSLETSERTTILSKIFEVCLQAAGPARELHESFESDPETAGRLHERRTTIDHEPDVPNVEHSPEKPSGKENKPQNRKTDMAPPKTIPRKAKKTKTNQDDTVESRKSVKRTIEIDNKNDPKRSRNVEGDVDNSKIKAGLKGGSAIQDKGETVGPKVQKRNEKQHVNPEKDADLEIDGQKKISGKTMQTVKDTAKAAVDPESDTAKKAVGKIVKSKTSSNAKVVGSKNTNRNEDDGTKSSREASSKVIKKRIEKNNDINVNSKDIQGNAGRSEHETENTAMFQNDKIVSNNVGKQKGKAVMVNLKKDTQTTNNKPTVKNTVKSKDKENKENNTLRSKNSESTTNTKNNNKKVSSSKNDVANTESSKPVTNNTENAEGFTSNVTNTVVGISKRATYTKDANTEENVTNKKGVNDMEPVIRASSQSAAPKNIKDIKESGISKKVNKNADKDTKLESRVGKAASVKTTTNVLKNPKDYTTKSNETNSEVNNKLVTKGNNDKNTKLSGEVSESSKVVKEKQTESAKITTKGNTDKEKAQVGEKRKINPKSTEQTSGNVNNKTFTKTSRNDEQSEKTDELPAKKIKTTEPVTKNLKTNSEQSKKTANTEKSKSNPEGTVNTRILKEKTNSDETLQEAVENNKITQNKTNHKSVTKFKIVSLSKLPAEKQIKLADKIKTKIPMMKTTFSSLSNKLLMNNAGKKSNAVESTKIPLKSIPVFKKTAKHLPTRISPRKLAKFNPYKRFSNKQS